ncbi:Ku protein [Kribbella sp. NPDC051587]|uniref:non-homologous end joining protein Ku n=1 Tax=Kribbella sp. NPDC051587 TaxID=3364119 RepID=UPI0037961D56
MQAIWKGAISFGMVTIPIKVFSATEEKDISFRQVHVADGGRIRYKRICSIDGEEVPYSDIGKGYEMPDGRMIVLEPDDFADLPLTSKKVIDVLEFVPADQVDPLYLGKSYYLQADGGPGAKPYVLLRDALEGSELYALVKVALRSRESLGLLRTVDNILILQVMLWPDEIRDAAFAAPPEDVEIRSQEKAMASSYIDTLRGEFDPEQYHDEYRQALEQVVEAKAAGVPLPADSEEEETEGAEVVDLVAALRASVEAAKARRAGAGDAPAKKAPAKKTAEAKSPAKKTAAKKTTTKKTAKKAAKKSA